MSKAKSTEKWIRNGVPYGPQVNKLKEKYPLPEEGTVITHEDLEAVINESRPTQRYYGICNAWRGFLFKAHNIDSVFDPGKGIKILNPVERLDVHKDGFLSGCRKIKREVRKASATDRARLDEGGKMRFDHEMTNYAKTIAAAEQTRKELPIALAPIKSLPRPKLVGAKVS